MLDSMSWKPVRGAHAAHAGQADQSPLYIPSIRLLSSRGKLDMAKAMKYRKVKAALLASGCRWKRGKGDHIKWYCPCGNTSPS